MSGRHHVQSAYGFAIQKYASDDFTLIWTVDRYYEKSRQRFPTKHRRWTDRAGAMRFAKKHGLTFDFDAP